MAMSSIARREYLREIQKQYRTATKAQKSGLLLAAIVVTGMNRKYLIGLLSDRRALRVVATEPEKRGRKTVYDAAFHDALVVCWHAENDICAERLQPFLVDLVPKLEACGELQLLPDTRRLLLSASVATVARHLGTAKRRSTIPLGTTKPGSLLKSQIAVRKGRWKETNPGWCESDTVAHGGDTTAGHFIFTYDFIDIATGWVELEACLGKGERTTITSLTAVRERFPFPLLGIDSIMVVNILMTS